MTDSTGIGPIEISPAGTEPIGTAPTGTERRSDERPSNRLGSPEPDPTEPASSAPARLVGRDLVVGYGGSPVIDGLSIEVPDGEFTAILGPNACGKSTLLKTLSRMLAPSSGTVVLDDEPILSLPAKAVARVLGLLPQSPTAPDGIVVEDLVGRGRFPHQTLLRQWSRADTEAVDRAMERARVADLRDRQVSELSGGQRQRVWLAMVLAQETPMLLLDEPTTFLDIAHQLEVLDLCDGLRRDGHTVVAVLHDLNLAFRYAGHVVVMAEGAIVAAGHPSEVVSAALIDSVFDIRCRIISDPETSTPMVIPLAPSR